MDSYFGVEVRDPYRWLEDDRSKETESWVKAENETTFAYFKNISFRSELKKRLELLQKLRRQNFMKIRPHRNG